MSPETIKTVAYVLVCLCNGAIIWRAMDKRDPAVALLALASGIGAFLLKVQIT